MDFHNICNAGTSKLLDVQCKFMFILDCNISPEVFVSLLYISVAIKVRFLKFNKNSISKLVLVFF